MPKIRYFCGPYYTPQWLKWTTSFIFNPACKVHDVEYEKRSKGRLLIDFIFFLDMLVILVLLLRKIVVNMLKFIGGCFLCPVFFVLVVCFGWISYNRKR